MVLAVKEVRPNWIGSYVEKYKGFEVMFPSKLENSMEGTDKFAIDKQGYIYRGRYTKSMQVPLEKKEKIPTNLSEGDRILGLDKQQQENS